jgi:hypothetical protein
MRRRNSASLALPTYAARRDTASVSWGYFVLTVVCACLLAAGFFLAARQHFNTMEFGFKNGKLRKQVEDLQTEKRRLMLAREVALSPAEIKRSAKSLGFRDGGEIAAITVSAVKSAKAEVGTGAPKTITQISGAAAKAKPEKAVSSESVHSGGVDDKSVKKIVMQSARKNGGDLKHLAEAR